MKNNNKTNEQLLEKIGKLNEKITELEKFKTERKQAEKELYESEERFRVLYNNSPDMYVSVSSDDASILFCNETLLNNTGYSRKEIIGSPIFKMYHGDCMDEVKKTIKQFIEKSVIHDKELILKRKDGSKIHVSLNVNAVKDEAGEVLYSIFSWRDITERKRSTMIQTAQYNIARAMTTAVDLQTLFTIVKAELAKLTDAKNFILAFYDEKSGLLHAPFEKDEKDAIPAYWKAEKSMTGRVIRQEKSLLLKKKEINKLINKGEIDRIGTIPEVWLGIPLFTGETVFGAIVMQNYEHADTYDETAVQLLEVIARGLGNYIARKQTESERERLSAAIEQSAEMVVITDPQGNIRYVNPAFEQVTGYTRVEALGQNPRILSSGEHDQSFYKELWDTICGGRVWHGKMVNRCKDGSLFTEESTISPVFNTTGNISNYVAVKRDITKEQKLEKQIQQAQKMESVGRLAGGVAHDFNNMLTVIMGYSELALAKLDPADKLYNDIQEINKAGKRSADLTTQLLAFSRKQTIAPLVLDLNDTVSNMLKMLRRLIGEDINMIWMPGVNLWAINIDPAQIDQILANLCVNARDAIDGTGKVIIETENVTFDEAYCKKYTYVKPGAYIMLSVSDDGCGMDEETKAQIFEPFFTTKTVSEGTGLGLATVYGIVKQNEGFVNVYSEPGQGTSFKIYFPRYKGIDLVEKEEKEMELPKGHGERIILVEDEIPILELAQSMLERIEYVVIAANTPQEALRLAQEQSGKIDMLMTDVVMPGMNGKELASKIHAFCPEMKVLFMSGYTSNVIVHRGVLDEGVNFITKPFSLAELAEKVNEALK